METKEQKHKTSPKNTGGKKETFLEAKEQENMILLRSEGEVEPQEEMLPTEGLSHENEKETSEMNMELYRINKCIWKT